MLYLIGFILTGFVVGLIARALKPGDDSMSIGKTTLMGMGGALLAGWVGHMVGWYESGEGAGLLASTLGAIAVIWTYYAVTHRNKMIGH